MGQLMPCQGDDCSPGHHNTGTSSVNPLVFLSCSQNSIEGVVLMVVHANQYLFQKRGIFYFHRRVPKDLMHHYDRSKIIFSLRTKSIRAAKVKAASLASQLNEDWLTLRWRSKDTPLRRFLSENECEEGQYDILGRKGCLF